MKANRNQKINRICRKLYSKYRKNVISLVTAAVLLVTSMPLADISGVVSKMVSTVTNAISAMAEDTYTDITNDIKNGVYTIQNAEDFKKLLNADPADYQKITVLFSNNQSQFKASDFTGIEKGLGNENYPFMGTVKANEGSAINLPINFALFEYLSDSANLDTIIFARPEDKNSALLAENVIHGDVASANKWKIKADPVDDSGATSYKSFTSVIGNMKNGAKVDLDITLSNDVKVEVSDGDNAGLACGTMDENTSLAVNLSSSSLDVSGKSNAGVFVGKMSVGATLNIDKCGTLTVVNVSANNAGGLVGSAENAEINVDKNVTLTMTGRVTGSVTAGGLFGSYTYSKADEKTFDISKFSGVKMNLDCPNGSTAERAAVGSVFGELINSADSAKISITGTANDTITSNFNGTVRAGFYGGIVGRYSVNALSSELTLSDITVNVTRSCNALDFGGIIGKIGDNSKAYVSVKNTTVSIKNSTSSQNNYGGLVGYADQAFIDVSGKVTVTANDVSANQSVGGIVGKFNNNGIVRLGGETDLSGFYPKDPNKNRCQLVGNRGNALIYSLSGWSFKRTSSKVIDDMDWGGVLRLNDSDLLESADGVLSFDGSGHTVTINGFTNNGITISNRADFARAALIMQHDSNDSNDFVKYSGASRADMLAANISLGEDVDISGTGLTGFMRDNGEDTFTGTLNGNDNKITMTVGKENDKDKIVFHTHNGLFAKTSGAKISNLTLVSNLNIVGDNVSGGDACYIGSVSAYNSGALTIDSVTADVTAAPSGAYTNFVGGLVGYVADATSEVSFTNSAVTANLTYDNSTTKVDCTCLGGVIGMVGAVKSKPTTGIKFDNVTVGGNITDKHTGSNSRVGGLIAEVGAKDNSASVVPNKISITNVNINALTINSSGKSNSGGFLGHNWYRVEIDLNSLNVNNSSLTVNNGTELGGLVLSTTGYWSIKEVSFDGVTVKATKCINFGMLASTLFGRDYDSYGFDYFKGENVNNYRSSRDATYFELTKPNGYKISQDTKINISPSYSYFDEIARCSIYYSSSASFMSNRQAIISIPAVTADGERLLYMDGKNCNTYQNQTTNNGAVWKNNSWARYYYNLDVYKNGKAITGGARATVWSAKLFAANNIKNYINSTNIDFPTDAEIDLTGYSFYPVDTNGCNIKSNSTITFENNGFNQSEMVSSSNSDNYARTTEGMDGTNLNNVHNQHYMMQSGLFRNENGAVTISGKLTFKGNIGKVNGGSGALVCGSVADDTNTSKKSVKITGSIVLDDLYVNDGETISDYAPLLINKIGNMTEITIQNVSQKKHSMTAEQYYKGGQKYAATSLIGNVGSEKGQNISLTFSNIKLDASDVNSIFKNATLLESFQHSDGAGSSAIYNYKWDDDWGTDSAGNIKHNVTYGKEVSDTKKNVDNDGNSRQNKYHGDWSSDDRYTSPDQNNATEEYSFTNYKPYVAKSYDTTQNYDEIDVNLERPYLIKGCGTYSDPYILDASTLAEVARVISTAAPTNGWEVNYNANASADRSTVDAGSAFCKGTKHETYTYDGSDKFVSGTKNVSKDNLIKYLCEAYYKIDDDIVLGSSFAGLGGTSNSYVFRGVIVGQQRSDGTYPTITNKSASPLIRFSSGSVVKDINIKYTKEVTLSKNNNNKLNYSTGKTEYYGGVMGVVFGGDNIIDNVKVTNPKITFANNDNSKQHLITAGGYVGAIVYGGVIFRNMGNVAKDSALTTSNTEAVDENADTNLFINPYIGRVVNGFAIEEGTKFGKSTNLNNGRKNYLITQFNSELSDDEKLNVIAGTTNTIEVPNAQALFMLSIISQSGMGYTDRKNNTCGYGHYTFTRNADYSKVGSAALTSDDTDYKTALSDYQRLEKATSKEYEKKNSVMLKKYTKPSEKGLYEAKWAHELNKNFTVKLTGNETYDLTDTGFRGINQLFDAKDSNLGGIKCDYTLSLTAIQGNDKTIKLDTDIKAYAVKITDNKSGNTIEFQDVDNYKYRTAFASVKGVGLINCSTYALTVNNLNLSGKISVKTYNNDGKSYVNEDLSTGGIVGGVQGQCRFSGITLNDLEVSGAYTVGGLIGKSTNNINISGVKSENSGIYVFGGFETGGLVGNSQKGSEFNVKDSKITINKVEFANLDKGTGTWFGVGGIVGSANIKTTISNVRLIPYNTDSFIGSKKDNKPLATQTMNEGGLIGLSNEVCTIENTSVSVDVYGSNAGGFVGINKKQLSVNENCYYGGTSETSACGVYGYASSGGMVGTQNEAVNISKSAVKNAVINIPTAKNGDAGIGGYVGIKANGDLKITDCEVNNVKLSAEDKSNGAGAGGVIGHNDGGNTYAYDILINKLSYIKGNNSVSVSNLIGWNKDKNLSSEFIGVSVNNTDCLPDIQYNASQIPANFIAVHSDYNGTQDNTQNIGEGSGTHVDIYSPYVNINPSKTVGDKIFTGDLVGGNMQTIISDAASYTNGTTQKSYGINSTIKTYAEDLGNSKLTTFKQASELDVQELNDLPVLLIDDNSSLNITQMLAKYISVLTNYDVLDSSSNKLKTTDLMNVSTATYVYDNGSLKKSDKSTLTFNSKTGYFKVTDGQYDNDGTNRFTVITLDYIDPTGSGKTALRLHIPVFVRKVLDFSFNSYVISGTDYNHSHYTDKTKLAFESFDAPVTTYFKYSYYKSANEWEKMLNNGDSLLWSFDKKLYLIGDNAADSGVLTDDTKLTLVDANNNDKTYHSTASDAKFNKTTGELDLINISGFKPVTMNDVLLRYASVTAAESSDGTLVEADEATATVKTSDGKYYKPAGEGETGTYKITVSANSDTPKNDNDEMIISESYYLTITIPESGSSKKVIKNFVNYYSGNTSRKLNGNLPTHLVDSNTGTYVIANFFKQEVSVDAHDPEEITASNNFVHATMTSKISIDQSLRDTFNGYKSDDFNMYQAFKFSMKSFDENDAGANARIIAGTSVNVDYSILNSSDTELSNAKISKTETLSEAKDSYMLMYPDSVYDYINSDTNGSITVKADISLTYGTAGIIDQFPERKDGDTKTGIGVNAASYVAYSQNNIENSSISASGVMPARRYYRKAMTVAQLNYNVAESTVLESKDSPFSQLGINAKDMTTGEMAITANAIYDLSALSRSTRDSGKKIQYTLKLYVKDNSGEYKQTNDISKYLSSFTLENATSNSGLNGKECVFTTDYNGEEQNTAVTKFTVKTGKAFEEQGLTYANYRVELTAVLLNDNNSVVNGTTASDYVVYTNAKIETGFIN